MNEVLKRLSGKRSTRVVGLMSGTSADGVDVVIVDISARGVTVRAFDTYPYAPALRRQVFKLFDPATGRADDICHLNFVLGEVFADAVINLARSSGIPLGSIDLIGSHGQTICHIPEGRRCGRRRLRSTLQIAEPSVVAERTGITTVADFRPRDVAAGGQGAPLVPFADYVLFAHSSRTRAVQNIGGVANVTFLPAGGRIGDIVAFDTGPGNMILDRLAGLVSKGRCRYDADGRRAARGKVNRKLLAEWMGHRYFRRRPPKTTGREEFGVQFADEIFKATEARGVSGADLMATATGLTAESIADAYRRFGSPGVDEVILCGGGARNRTLVRMLQDRLRPAKVLVMDEIGISADAKEAVSFAILAAATVRGVANNVPTATGATRPVVLGKIVPAGNGKTSNRKSRRQETRRT